MLVNRRRREVADVTGQVVLVEGGDDRRLVHDLRPGEVEDDGRVLHQSQTLGGHEAARGLDKRDVDREDVSPLEDLLHRLRTLNLSRQVPGVVHGDRRVIAHHLQAEPERRVGHTHANGPQADDAEGLAGQLKTDELLLACLDRLGDLGVGSRQLMGKAGGGNEVARGDEQTGQDQLLDRVGVGARGVEDRNTSLGHLGNRDVVRPGAGTGDSPDGLRDRGVMQLGGPHEQGVGRLHALTNLVALSGETGQSEGGNGIEGLDAQLGHDGPSGAGGLQA